MRCRRLGTLCPLGETFGETRSQTAFDEDVVLEPENVCEPDARRSLSVWRIRQVSHVAHQATAMLTNMPCEQYHFVDDIILAGIRGQERHSDHLAIPAPLRCWCDGECHRISRCRSSGQSEPPILPYT